MAEIREHQEGFLIQGTLTRKVLISFRIYKFTDLKVGGAAGELFSAEDSRLWFNERIFAWGLDEIGEAELERRILELPLSFFYRFVTDLSELEEQFRRLYQEQGYPSSSARSHAHSLIQLAKAMDSASN